MEILALIAEHLNPFPASNILLNYVHLSSAVKGAMPVYNWHNLWCHELL